MKKYKFALSCLALSVTISAFTVGCGLTSVSNSESSNSEQNGAFVNIETTTATPDVKTVAENITEDEQVKPIRKLKTMEITDKSSCYHKTLNSVDYFNYAKC